jgi:hypothetical protein
LITGPVSANMRCAVLKPGKAFLAQTASLSGVRDLGESTGGIRKPAMARRMIPIDLYIPRLSPASITILDGLLRLLGRRLPHSYRRRLAASCPQKLSFLPSWRSAPQGLGAMAARRHAAVARIRAAGPPPSRGRLARRGGVRKGGALGHWILNIRYWDILLPGAMAARRQA